MAAFPMVPFWSVFERVPKRTGYGSEELLSVYRNFGVIRKADRDDNNNRPGQSLDDYQLVEPHNLVFNKMKAWQGSLGISAYRGIVSPAYFVYRPVSDFNGRYMHHLLRCTKSIDFYAANSKGIRVNQWDLEPEQLNQMKVPLPDLDTQRRIANYLDAETAQIDTLVAELDEYVELLEKRKLVVRTSLLNSVPSNLIKLNMLGTFKTGTTPKKLVNDNQGVYWIKPDGLSEESTGQKITHECIGDSGVLPAGTTYVCGIGATIGKVGFSATEATSNQQITGIIPNSLVAPKLLYHLISEITDELRATAPRSTLPILNNVRLGSYKVAVPEMQFQEALITTIEEELTRTDSIITQCRELKELLLKRRQVLITDVVTGKVEV